MGECVKLESNLRNKLSIVQEREKNLISLEEKLKNDFAAKSMDVSLSQKRMKEEMVHKVNLEKSKVTDLQSRYEQIKHELEKEKNKVKGVEEEFNEYRKRMRYFFSQLFLIISYFCTLDLQKKMNYKQRSQHLLARRIIWKIK